jgi:hypothetical protein
VPIVPAHKQRGIGHRVVGAVAHAVLGCVSLGAVSWLSARRLVLSVEDALAAVAGENRASLVACWKDWHLMGALALVGWRSCILQVTTRVILVYFYRFIYIIIYMKTKQTSRCCTHGFNLYQHLQNLDDDIA